MPTDHDWDNERDNERDIDVTTYIESCTRSLGMLKEQISNETVE